MKKYILCILITLGTLTLNAQCVDNGNYWNESWVSCTTSANPNPTRGNSLWMLYEFHEPHTIDSTYIWNANRTGESGWGARDVIIDYSPDGTSWVTLGQYTFPQAPETANYGGFVGPIFGSLEVQKILFTIVSTHETPMNCASIAEVQFKVVCTEVWYEDVDNDGLGNPLSTVIDCTAPDGYVSNNVDNCDDIVWEDAQMLFDENGCTGCHGGGASSGLRLDTYANFSAGGSQCNGDITTGNTLVEIIQNGYTCPQGTVPAMNGSNYAGNTFDATELAMLQAWIDNGAPETCQPACATVDLDIRFDGFPFQTSWDIQDMNGVVVDSGGSYSSSMSNTLTTENTCLPDGCYTLNFYDALGNGMCPFRATASSGGIFVTPGTLIIPGATVATLGTVVTPGLCGNYSLYDVNGTTLASGGGGFGAAQTSSFCLTGGSTSRIPQQGNIHTKTADDTQIRIIPNIVKDETTVYYSLETNEDIQIQVVDITGKIIQQYKRNPDDINEVQLNTSHLSSGFYYVQLVSGQIMLTEKFVKK